MTATRLTPLWSAFRYPSCRSSTFAASPSSTCSKATTGNQYGALKWHAQSRTIHSSCQRRQEYQNVRGWWNEPPSAEGKSALSPSEAPLEETSQLTNVPWYLQDQLQEPEANPFAERQRMPELPENPPPVLQPLLQHISVDLGLDYLSILDLRSLDPPPAFGANLLMIIGSARSEKHLNVSADRLCRWLRTNYKLRPHADGLLGRNELKLKLRRKNRKSRIMNAAGGTALNDPDDGISTGWICVDVGTVEGGLTQASEEQPQFVGFGTGARGARVVVQMLTEEKRGDVDLDGLWQGMLDRETRRKEGERKAKAKEGAEKDLDIWLDSREMQSSSPNARREQSQASLGSSQQVRSMHTTARRPHAETSSHHSTGDTLYSLPPPPSKWMSNLESEPAHIRYFLDLSPAQAIHALGAGEQDLDSTAFLRSYHSTQPVVRPPSVIHAGIRLHCHAIQLGHPGYTRDRLLALLRECQACGYDLPEHSCMQALNACLTAHNVVSRISHQLSDPAHESRAVIRRCFTYAKEVFEIMEIYGYNVTTAAIFKRLHALVMDPVFLHPNHSLIASQIQGPYQTTSDIDTLNAAYAAGPRQHLSHAIRNAIELMYVPTPAPNPQGYDSHLFKTLLVSYIQAQEWPSFWSLWQQLARRMLPRDAEMYAILYQGMARGGDKKIIAEALIENVDEMDREEPPVVLEREPEVARTLKYALLVIGTSVDGGEPFARFWKRVQKALGEGS